MPDRETLKTLQPAVGIDLLQPAGTGSSLQPAAGINNIQPAGSGAGTPTPTPTPSVTNNAPVTNTPTSNNIFDREAFAKRLEEIRQQTLEIQRQANQLKENESADLTDVVSSSEPVIQEEKDLESEILKAQEPRPVDDSAKELLEDYISSLDKRRKEETQRITEQFENEKAKQASAQRREVGTTSVTLSRLGGYLGGSGSGTGVLLTLAETHRNEMSVLESKKNAAIAAAQTAIDDKQFAAVKELAAEIRSIDKEIDDRRNTFFDQSLDLIKEDRQREEFAIKEDRASSEFQAKETRIRLKEFGLGIDPFTGDVVELPAPENVVIKVDESGTVRGLDKNTGQIIWETPGAGRAGSASPNIQVTPITDPITGSPSVNRIIDKDNGTVKYVDVLTGQEIPASEVQVEAGQDPLDTLINELVNDVTSEILGELE